MKWSFASVGVVIFGLFGIIIIIFFHEITVSNEQDYFTLKEATEAAMIESVDTAYYRLTGKIKISEEKFVENFTKRFAKSATFGQGDYYIDFYQISEYPAKVSLRIVDPTNSYNIFNAFDKSLDATQVNVVNQLTAILDGHQNLDMTSGGTYDADYWRNEEPPAGARAPTVSCRKYEQEPDKSKVHDLRYDFSNKNNYLCVYNRDKPEDEIGKQSTIIYDQIKAPATVTCDRGYTLVKGWCLKN